MCVLHIPPYWTVLSACPTCPSPCVPTLSTPQPKPPSAESWDDRVNSARLECTCAAGTASCAAFWPKVKARFFADPWPRKTKGGPFTDLTCTTSDARKCSGLFDRMPDKWNGRTSGMAVVFDRDDFTLPRCEWGIGLWCVCAVRGAPGFGVCPVSGVTAGDGVRYRARAVYGTQSQVWSDVDGP